jgi:hypothetical protein
MPKLRSKRWLSLAIATLFLSSPIFAQQRRSTAPRKQPQSAPSKPKPALPPPTFDTLLGADNYRVYAEVRNVGQLLRSPALTDLLDPMVKLGKPPKEFKTILKWLDSQADVLASSRMFVASWSTQPKLPVALVAIEFPSVEDAQKFDPKLRRFIPTLLPTPTPTPKPTSPGEVSTGPVLAPLPPSTQTVESGPALPPYVIKQVGTLVLISDKPFAFKDLLPRGSKLLSEDQNFSTARNRFASESIFVYIDTKSIQKEQEEQQKKYEEEQKKRDLEAASSPPVEVTVEDPDAEIDEAATHPDMVMPPLAVEPSPIPEVSPQTEGTPTLTGGAASIVGDSPSSGMSEAMMMPFYSALFGGQSMWPEAIGVAVAFEGDSYVLRTLIINGPDNKANAIPFIPQLVSGPPLVPESSNIFPADTELFVAFSVDYPQVYERMVKAVTDVQEMAKKYEGRQASMAPPPEPPFAAFEKALGMKIKDDVLPLFGNELAFALPAVPKPAVAVPEGSPQPEGPAGDNSGKKAQPPPDPSPVIAISVKDRDAVRLLIPKIIESLGVKGAKLLAQTEKRDDTEIISYAGAFSYAFVGNFLVLSPDPAATRRVVDSFLNHETLSSNGHYRNSVRWQPRQLLGQVYVAPDLVERYFPMAIAGVQGQEELRNFMYRLSPVIDPVSYSLTNDGIGPVHEVHVPRNMVMLMVAGMAKDAGEPSAVANESVAKGVLRTVVSAEETFKSTQGDGRYGTLEELIAAGLFDKSWLQSNGYRLELTASGTRFEAMAVPTEYGKTGLMSFFVDESGVLRGGDHGGGNATPADNPIQ